MNYNAEKLTLGYILNLLDGILETPGRILICTSNHPETLDPALIRPGRIDINLTVGFCTPKMFADMYNFFFKTNTSFKILLQQCFLKCFKIILIVLKKLTHNYVMNVAFYKMYVL
jgi:SpoVK/Ycf46/Vps4 family AAA+-type ATPase